MELLIAVFCHGFMVVAFLTKALPITLIPEQLCIPSVGSNVVNNGGFHQPSLFLTLHTQGMRF